MPELPDPDLPQREQTGEVDPPRVATPNIEVPVKTSESPAEKEWPRRGPVRKAEPERRAPTRLNVYVNQNAEWASQQFVSTDSPRAVFRQKTGHRCPKCGSQDTRLSSSRQITDWFMFLFNYTKARCRNCDTRFRIWRSRTKDVDERRDVETDPPAD